VNEASGSSTTARGDSDLARARRDGVARVQALAPQLRARSAQADLDRRISDATKADFEAAGLWRLLQPARFGGGEQHPLVFFDALIETARHCPSTAWVFGVLGCHAWQLALFDEQAQQDVWGEDSSVLVSSSYAPTGKVQAVEGGYEISGLWSFSSGSELCDWAFLGGFVPSPEGRPPDMRTFLVPRSDYRIDRTWDTMALQGTGSHDVVIEKAFVPEYRTHRMSDGFKCQSPGHGVNPSPLYKLPFGLLFTRSVSTGAIGMLHGALDAYLSVARGRVSASEGSRVVEDPRSQQVCAEARLVLDEVKLVLERSMLELSDAAEAGENLTIERRVQFRYESAQAVDRCIAAGDMLHAQSGGRAIFKDAAILPYFTALHAARAHYANNPYKPGQNFGRVLLGLKTKDFFL